MKPVDLPPSSTGCWRWPSTCRTAVRRLRLTCGTARSRAPSLRASMTSVSRPSRQLHRRTHYRWSYVLLLAKSGVALCSFFSRLAAKKLGGTATRKCSSNVYSAASRGAEDDRRNPRSSSVLIRRRTGPPLLLRVADPLSLAAITAGPMTNTRSRQPRASEL